MATLGCLAALPYLVRGGLRSFMPLDDPAYVYENPAVTDGITWDGVRWAFSTFHTGNWHPLTWVSHMLDANLFGSEAWGHHLTNILLHTANTALLAGAGLGVYRTLSRYPALTQDLAIVCPEEMPAALVEETVRAAAGDLLASLRLFDVYRGDPLPTGTRSLAFTLIFQAQDRTLAEDDMQPARARIIAALREQLGVELRS